MFVTIFILIGIIFLNHILLCLASFDYYCGSFAVNRVVVLVASGAVKAIQHILWTQIFLAIFLNGIYCTAPDTTKTATLYTVNDPQ